MTYETARDIHPRSFRPTDAACEYLRLFVEDPGLAAGFRIGCRRRFSARDYATFRRHVKLIEG
jgi:hypothetical protein